MYTLLRKFRTQVVGLALLMLALAGCGGSDDSSAPDLQSVKPVPHKPANAAPKIQGTPVDTALVGQAYTFQPSASDPNGDALTFSAANLPAWLSLDAATGRVYGTPADADVGAYSGITISVSDGQASTSLAAFTITVAAAASGAATLSWMPPTQNSDGTTLSDLAGYEVRYGRTQTDLTYSITLENASLSTYVVENLASGTWYFAVVAINSAGVISPLSNVAAKTIG